MALTIAFMTYAAHKLEIVTPDPVPATTESTGAENAFPQPPAETAEQAFARSMASCEIEQGHGAAFVLADGTAPAALAARVPYVLDAAGLSTDQFSCLATAVHAAAARRSTEGRRRRRAALAGLRAALRPRPGRARTDHHGRAERLILTENTMTAMFELLGKISDRIRSGEIPADALHPGRDQPKPSAGAVKNASGHGLGRGALRDGTNRSS